ncbi:exopolyphosphatase [Martiniozyma asiatica (nom. inval.)]|nr:exopolyphosphatase [Martiniozyma asiatica]
MNQLSDFIKSLPNLFKTACASRKVAFVSGNSSADMDSVVCAITFSYFSHLQQRTVFPLINIPKDELKLRKDIDWLLKDMCIDPKDLLYADDLSALSKKSVIDFVLVDHNSPQGKVKEIFEGKEYECNVVGIIDHHLDEGKFINAKPREITVCGSCSTLVMHHFLKTIADIQSQIDDKFISFLLAPLCADTSGLQYRVEKIDTEIVQKLTQIYPPRAELVTQLTSQLKVAKENIDGLSVRDLLRKDYKEFSTPHGKMGISSMVKGFEALQARFSIEEIEQSLDLWKRERDLFLAVVMTSFTDNDQFNREIIVYPHNVAKACVSSCQKELALKNGKTFGDFEFFQQQNLKASRKQVAPLLIEYYANN